MWSARAKESKGTEVTLESAYGTGRLSPSHSLMSERDASPTTRQCLPRARAASSMAPASPSPPVLATGPSGWQQDKSRFITSSSES